MGASKPRSVLVALALIAALAALALALWPIHVRTLTGFSTDRTATSFTAVTYTKFTCPSTIPLAGEPSLRPVVHSDAVETLAKGVQLSSCARAEVRRLRTAFVLLALAFIFALVAAAVRAKRPVGV